MKEDRNKLLEELYSQYYNSIYQMCLLAINFNPQFYYIIDDCVQDAFVKAILHYDKFKNYENQVGWLVRVASNRAKEKVRKEQTHLRVISSRVVCEREDMTFPYKDEDQRFKTSEMRESIMNLYNTLTSLEKKVFCAYFLEEKSLSQVAKEHALSDNSVRAAIRRIRSKAKHKKKIFFLIFLWCFLDYLRII